MSNVRKTCQFTDPPFNGAKIVNAEKFWSEPLGKNTLGGITEMKVHQDLEGNNSALRFSATNDMEVEGDLEVKGDLFVDGDLKVTGQIKASYASLQQAASQELEEDEIFLTPAEIEVINVALNRVLPQLVADRLETSLEDANSLVSSILHKLAD